MSTDRLGTATEPATSRPQLILPPGFVDAIDPATGQVVAVRVQDQPLPASIPEPVPGPSALDKARWYAAAQPDPLPAAAPPPAQGISPIVGQVIVLGGIASLALLAAGGAIYIACEGLHVAGPWFHDAAEFLKYAALVLAVAVVASVVAARKLGAAMTTTRTGDGTVVNALVHRHTEVHIGKQTGGLWKGQIHNNVR
jgi:hypothetical protein